MNNQLIRQYVDSALLLGTKSSYRTALKRIKSELKEMPAVLVSANDEDIIDGLEVIEAIEDSVVSKAESFDAIKDSLETSETVGINATAKAESLDELIESLAKLDDHEESFPNDSELEKGIIAYLRRNGTGLRESRKKKIKKLASKIKAESKFDEYGLNKNSPAYKFKRRILKTTDAYKSRGEWRVAQSTAYGNALKYKIQKLCYQAIDENASSK